VATVTTALLGFKRSTGRPDMALGGVGGVGGGVGTGVGAGVEGAGDLVAFRVFNFTLANFR
jgi:hypothetical protein